MANDLEERESNRRLTGSVRVQRSGSHDEEGRGALGKAGPCRMALSQKAGFEAIMRHGAPRPNLREALSLSSLPAEACFLLAGTASHSSTTASCTLSGLQRDSLTVTAQLWSMITPLDDRVVWGLASIRPLDLLSPQWHTGSGSRLFSLPLSLSSKPESKWLSAAIGGLDVDSRAEYSVSFQGNFGA